MVCKAKFLFLFFFFQLYSCSNLCFSPYKSQRLELDLRLQKLLCIIFWANFRHKYSSVQTWDSLKYIIIFEYLWLKIILVVFLPIVSVLLIIFLIGFFNFQVFFLAIQFQFNQIMHGALFLSDSALHFSFQLMSISTVAMSQMFLVILLVGCDYTCTIILPKWFLLTLTYINW